MKKFLLLLLVVMMFVIGLNVYFYSVSYKQQLQQNEITVRRQIQTAAGDIEKSLLDLEQEIKYSFSVDDFQNLFLGQPNNAIVEKKIRYFLYRYNELVNDIKITKRDIHFSNGKIIIIIFIVKLIH